MPDVKPVEVKTNAEPGAQDKTKENARKVWEAPKLEDVSEQVMAQPYIRFT